MSGAKRLKEQTSKATVRQRAGDPENPSTFLTCNENESQTTAYLGYKASNELRDLAASWPLLRAYVKFSTIMENLRTHDALRLLHTSHDEFQNVEDPNSKWPFSTTKDQAIASAMKVRHLGWLLIRLKADLEAMASHSAQQNQHLQSQYFDDFSAIHTNPDAPVVPPNHINRTVKPPILGPLETETAVEPYNRCLMALKYLQHGLRSKKLYKRLADEPKKGKPINASSIPEFMRPKPAPAKQIPISQAITEADNLPDIEFNVSWNPKFDADDLEDELEERDSTGEKRPNSKQHVNTDPRLFPSLPAFRDQLRRQYSCADMHMQIHRLSLEYKTTDGSMFRNLMRGGWADVQTIMRDPENKDFVFNIGFAPTEEEKDVFETDYNPSSEGYFG